MTIKEFFGAVGTYEGIMKSEGGNIGNIASNLVTLGVADRAFISLFWRNLQKAFRISQGYTENDGETIFIGVDSKNNYVYEYKSETDGKPTMLLYRKGNTVKLGYVTVTDSPENGTEQKSFTIAKVSCSEVNAKGENIGNALILASYNDSILTKTLGDDLEIARKLARKEFINLSDWNADDVELYKNRIARIKTTLFGAKDLGYDTFNGMFPKITESEMSSILKSNWTPLAGKSAFLKTEDPTKQGDALTYKKDKSGFLIAKPENWITPEKKRTPEELAKIPQIEKIEISDRAKKYYKAIMNTKSVPFRNFYFLGGAGIGKSTMCRVLAFMLGLPYSDTTCYAEMEMTDILGGVFPINNEDGDSREVSEAFYNSIFDEIGVSLDMLRDQSSFDIAYSVMTGEEKANVTQEEVFKLFVTEVSKRVAEKLPAKNEEGIIYKYVPSELVKSISADGIGGVHEIKEPTVIRNEGVLVGLNSLLAEGTLSLPNGEVVTRNPNSIIIMTSNADYAGCQTLNESVISRMHMVDNMDFLTAKEMTDRAKQIFGNALDKKYYKAMADVVKNVEAWIGQDEDNQGIASFREYQNWIEYTLKIYDGEPTKEQLIETAEQTIKFKASQRKSNLENGFDMCYKPLDMIAV